MAVYIVFLITQISRYARLPLIAWSPVGRLLLSGLIKKEKNFGFENLCKILREIDSLSDIFLIFSKVQPLDTIFCGKKFWIPQSGELLVQPGTEWFDTYEDGAKLFITDLYNFLLSKVSTESYFLSFR